MAVIHSPNAFMDRLNRLCMKLALTDEQYEALSLQAARELKENRPLYKVKVISLALLGYGYITLVVATLVGLAVLTFWLLLRAHFAVAGVKLVFILLLPLWFIAKSLWVKMPEPDGIQVTRKDAPELFELLDELSAKLKTKVDKVLIDSSFNAAVVQIPRLGMLGFYQNFLLLGVPLMLTQQPEQFKAVLAHEMGHLSNQHSKSSTWIYNLRGQWSKLLATIGGAGDFAFAIFLLFFSWFSPRFSAYSQAMARAHELEADASAVAITGAQSFTASMLRLPIYSHFLGEVFWPDIKKLIKVNATPPDDVFFRLRDATAQFTPDPAKMEKALTQSLTEVGSGADSHPPMQVRLLQGQFSPVLRLSTGNESGDDEHSHPSLKERLLVANFTPVLSTRKNQGSLYLPEELFSEITGRINEGDSAADAYLDRWLTSALTLLSEKWQMENDEGWRAEYQIMETAREGLLKLEEKAANEPLTLQEKKLKAFFVNQIDDEAAELAAYREILASHPQEADIRMHLGMLLLKENLDQGMIHIKSALSVRPSLVHDAAPVVVPLLKESGQLQEAERIEQQLADYYKEADLARKERNSVNGESILEPHGLDEEDVEYLQSFFSQLPTILEVYAVRKFVRYLPDCPYLVLGLTMKTKNKGAAGVQESVAMAQAIIQHLQIRYEFCVSVFDPYTAKLKKNILSMDDSLIYKR
ncbi:MAG: M48 family metalloprotease [Cyanobacteria bacterium REEB67]|nr:M48 family metalloprotease [Cyanobacteria bacterium REEB67]